MLSKNNKKYTAKSGKLFVMTLFAVVLITSLTSATTRTITSLPYSVTYSGSNYSETLIVAGTKLVSTTNGIDFNSGDHDIVLYLVNDTVSFSHGDSATSSGTSANINAGFKYGLNFAGGTYKIKIIGGVIMADPTAANVARMICVRSGSAHDITFEGTKFVISRGYNSHCVGGVASMYNIDYNNCKFENKMTGYTSRCNFDGVAVQYSHPNPGTFGTQGNQDGYHHFSFYGCAFDTVNGGALHFCGNKAFVNYCSTYVDNRNDFYTYYTEDFCHGTTNNGHLTASGLSAGSYIKNNYMVSRMNIDGTDMGILIEASQGTEANPVVVCSNYVEVRAGLDAHYGYMNAKALKTRYGNNHLHIFDNTFIAYSGTGHPNCEAYNILVGAYTGNFTEFGGGEIDSFLIIENNYIEARADDSGFSSLRAINAAIGHNCPSGWTFESGGNIWRNNHIKSAGNIYELSGMDGPGYTMLFDKDTVEFDENDYGETRYTFKVGYYLASTGNIARDCHYIEATDTNIVFAGSYAADIAIQRTLNILVMGNNDCPVGNANVTVVNNYGHTVLSGLTSSNGLITGPVTYYYEARTGSDSLNFNNFTITAVKSGETEITTLAVDRTHASATLQFDDVAGDCDVDITPPGTIYDLNAIPGENHGEINLTWTASGDDGDVGVADHYDIRYSTGAIFESNWSSANSCPSPPTPASPGQIQTFTIDGLAEGEAYFIAIKTYDDYDNVSDISNSPDTFAAGIAVPVQLATDIDSEAYTVELTSSVVESYAALYYKFMLDSLENYPDPMITLDLLADEFATATYSDLSDDVTYYWRVCAVAADNSDSSAWSSSTTFNLQTGVTQTLASTDCVYPLMGDIVVSRQPYLEVNNLADISQYYFQLSDNSQFDLSVESGAVPKSSGLTTTWQAPDPLEHGQQYFWRVSSNGSAWTSAIAFTVELNIHTYPNPFRPAEGHSQIVFTNLPENADLTVSTISGNIVLKQDDIGPDDWAWDVKNESGNDLSSGIYLYSINTAAGSTSGKVIVIR